MRVDTLVPRVSTNFTKFPVGILPLEKPLNREWLQELIYYHSNF